MLEARRTALALALLVVATGSAVKPLLCALASMRSLYPVSAALAAYIDDVFAAALLASALLYALSGAGAGPRDVLGPVLAPCIAAGGVYVALAGLAAVLQLPVLYLLGVLACYAGLLWVDVVGPALVAARVSGASPRRLLLPSLASYAAMMAVGLPLGYLLGATLGGVLYPCGSFPGYSVSAAGIVAEAASAAVYAAAAGRLLAGGPASRPGRARRGARR